MGNYACFVQNDWTAGLPHLARASDQRLVAIAELELKWPSATADVLKLGDSWWEMAKSVPDEESAKKRHMQYRAKQHYQTVVAQLSGLQKQQVLLRIEATDDIEPAVATSSAPPGNLLTVPSGRTAGKHEFDLSRLEIALSFDRSSVKSEANGPQFSDISENLNHASAHNVAQLKGVVGDAVGFNGTDSYVRFKRTVAADFTIAFWLRTNRPFRGKHKSTPWWSGSPLVDGEMQAQGSDFGVVGIGNSIALGLHHETLYGRIPVVDGRWHHCCIVRQKASGRAAIIIDGRPDQAMVGAKFSLGSPKSLTMGKIECQL